MRRAAVRSRTRPTAASSLQRSATARSTVPPAARTCSCRACAFVFWARSRRASRSARESIRAISGGAGLGAHPDLHGQVALVVGPVLEGLPVLLPAVAGRPAGVVVGAPPGAAEPLGLRGGRRGREVQQRGLAVRRRDAGQRPHLRVGQPAGVERGRDPRQPAQRPGHPDVFAGGGGRHAALPGDPVPAGVDAHAVPAAALVELGDQPQPRRGRRGQPHRAGGDRPGQFRQRRTQRELLPSSLELMFGRLTGSHRQKPLVSRSPRFRGSAADDVAGTSSSGRRGADPGASAEARFPPSEGEPQGLCAEPDPAGTGVGISARKQSCINWGTGALGLLTCGGATHHPDRRTEHADGRASSGPSSGPQEAPCPLPVRVAPRASPTPTPTEGYFDKRGLTRAAGFWGLWGLGVAAVISGDFSGWNFGIGGAGWGGFLIATAVVTLMYVFDDRQHRRDVGGACRTPAAPTRSRGRRWARGAGSSPAWPRRSSTSRRRR